MAMRNDKVVSLWLFDVDPKTFPTWSSFTGHHALARPALLLV
jgi:hypothetical protein